MQTILNTWLCIFWFSWLLFFLNTQNTIKLFITSEIVWIILYVYSLLVGIFIDDFFMYMLSLLIIILASVEFSIGFILIIFFKKVFKSSNTDELLGTDWSIINKINKYK